MFHLTVAVLWVLVYFGLSAYLPHATLERAGQVRSGMWVALALAAYNLLRGGFRLLLARRRTLQSEAGSDEPPPRPVVHPEFRVEDDRPSERPGENR